MKPQTHATQVANRVSYLLHSTASSGNARTRMMPEPVWFKVVVANPPPQDLTYRARNYEKYVNDPKRNKSGMLKGKYVTRNKDLEAFSSNGKHLYRIKWITYVEDSIRKLFYAHHPWEKARARLMVENTGNDSIKHDWSSIIQANKPLDAESVVQRTLWLWNQAKTENPEIAWTGFYDQARLEFYRIRMREEAEVQVAAEEASMFGGVFGKSSIEKGLELEQYQIEKWTKDALRATAIKRSRLSGTSMLGSYGSELNQTEEQETSQENPETHPTPA